ncbi:MAG: hypothetical protein J6S44_06525 [Clostridia bacterium]|nr:hypothetical protein [Clostridia bacterium]
MNKFLKNKILFLAAYIFRAVAYLCSTGTLMQLFLAEVGFSESRIYLHATLIQAANVAATVLCSRYADGKRFFWRLAFAQIPNGILFLFFLPFCADVPASTFTFICLLVICLMQSVFTALTTVADYKLPYFVIRTTDFALLQAIGGIFIAISTFGIGELLAYLQTLFPFETLMRFAFPVSAALVISAGVLSLFYTELTKAERSGKAEGSSLSDASPSPQEEKPKVSLFYLFRQPVFYQLIPATLLRGFTSGVTLVFATIALSLGFTSETALQTVSLAAVANLAACFLFGIASRYLSPRISIFISALTYLAFPLCLFGSPKLFLVAFTLILLGRNIIDNAVPTLLFQAVEADLAGPYNAWRMILHTTGTLLASSLATLLSPRLLLLLAMCLGLVSSITFFALPLLRKASPAFPRGRIHLLKNHLK